MAGKNMPAKQMPARSDDKSSVISADIAKVVEYLNAKRSTAHERSNGLAQEFAQRRDEIPSAPVQAQQNTLASRQAAEYEALAAAQSQANPSAMARPILAERYHSFCHDLDMMLDSFRARVEGNKPVQH